MAASRWRGRSKGTAAGAALAGVAATLASWPEYIDAAPAGLSVGAVGGIVGFAAGSWWDRRTARLQAEQEQQQRWQDVFSDGPTPVLPVQTAEQQPGAQLLLAQSAEVDFERGHLQYVTLMRKWCADREPGLVWLHAGGPGAGKTRVAMRVVQNLRNHTTDAWACG